jgi:hypothetical protein
MFPNEVAEAATDPVDFWYEIAERAIEHFDKKSDFMDFVNRRFDGDQNRMAASCCWDIIRLEEV